MCIRDRNIIDNIEQLSQFTQKLELTYHQELSALTELKQSILQEAFNGTLRIAEGLASQS